MVLSQVESALRAGDDPREQARLLRRMRDAVLCGGTSTTVPRAVIGDSWRRVRGCGLDPSGGQEVAPLDGAELRRRREASGLLDLLPLLRRHLLPAAEAAGQVMVVVDPDGRVLWREGGPSVRRRADALGFVEGSAWDESSVGTNAIGTSLVVGRPVHVFAAEHYAESHQPWTCAAAPLHDPLTGRLLGAVDLSGPAHTVHASTVALVDAVARLVRLELRAEHEQRAGGWLRPEDEPAAPPSRLVLDLRQDTARIRIGDQVDRSHALTPRHAEILLALTDRRAGRSAAELADDLFGDPRRTVTVRAELSRLRRTLGLLLEHMPYRIASGVEVRVLLPDRPERLLPTSVAPIVLELRRRSELSEPS